MNRQDDNADPEDGRRDAAPGSGADADEAAAPDAVRRRRIEALRRARIEGRLEVDPAVIADRLLDS